MPRAVNPCAKTVTPQNAYEVWQVADHPIYGGQWTWYVLKKYQSPEKEATNRYARWLCFVTSPYVPHGEYGDTYVRDILDTGAKQIANPLSCADKRTTGSKTADLTAGKEHQNGEL
jgi:hypothetical protein